MWQEVKKKRGLTAPSLFLTLSACPKSCDICGSCDPRTVSPSSLSLALSLLYENLEGPCPVAVQLRVVHLFIVVQLSTMRGVQSARTGLIEFMLMVAGFGGRGPWWDVYGVALVVDGEWRSVWEGEDILVVLLGRDGCADFPGPHLDIVVVEGGWRLVLPEMVPLLLGDLGL